MRHPGPGSRIDRIPFSDRPGEDVALVVPIRKGGMWRAWLVGCGHFCGQAVGSVCCLCDETHRPREGCIECNYRVRVGK